jgi:putative ABC transport system ATP-binding protein
VLITHNLKEALQYGNRLLQMSNGKINRDLNTETKANLSLQEIYKWFE